ncbi:MAG: glycosyltransferase family 9 protein [Betaproteobacteria bacterium]
MPGAHTEPSPANPKILVIRRDNIGDLILTTPLIRALRQRFPKAWIGVLVNSYTAQVLDNNPHIDEVFVYTKVKHRGSASVWSAYWSTLRLILRLRRVRIDYAVLASPAASSKAQMFARRIKAKTIVGFGECASPGYGLTAGSAGPLHEVEEVFRIARLFEIEGAPPATLIHVDDRIAERALGLVTGKLPPGSTLIGVHISARKVSQRLPTEKVVELLRGLREIAPDLAFVLFWSPGASDNATHPGDDIKGSQILQQLGDFPIVPFPTSRLSELFGGLSTCEMVICSDGGAMHAAAALGKPIVCFFGDSDPKKWHPWGVPYRLMQPESKNVADISLAEIVNAFRNLRLGEAPVTADLQERDGFNFQPVH